MASLSHAHSNVADPVVQPRRKSGARGRRAQARARGGIVWIALSGILLAGVVFVSVAVLRMNLALDQANEDRAKLHAQIASLQSAYSSQLRAGEIQAQAGKRFGLVYQDPSEYGYVQLAK
jgi:hypothetical protein